jgi:hypothetical protein
MNSERPLAEGGMATTHAIASATSLASASGGSRALTPFSAISGMSRSAHRHTPPPARYLLVPRHG